MKPQIEKLVLAFADDKLLSQYWGIDGGTYPGAENISPIKIDGKDHYILVLPDALTLDTVKKWTRVTIIVEEGP